MKLLFEAILIRILFRSSSVIARLQSKEYPKAER